MLALAPATELHIELKAALEAENAVPLPTDGAPVVVAVLDVTMLRPVADAKLPALSVVQVGVVLSAPLVIP